MNDTTNIFLRGLPRETLARIDARVDAINQRKSDNEKISRNSFLIDLITARMDNWLDDYKKDLYDVKTDQMIDLLEEYLRATDRVYDLLASGQVSEGLDLIGNLGDNSSN